MKKLKFSVTILMMFVFTSFLYSQEAVATAGGDASGSGGSVSFTIGQVFYKTVSVSGGVATEGVQQPFEIIVETGIEDAKDIDLRLSAYPNPTKDNLTLRIVDYERDNLSYQLYDVSGQIVKNKKITGNETLIQMSGLSKSVYILNVTDKNKVIKTFKIIKN